MNSKIILFICMILLILTLAGCSPKSDHEGLIIQSTTGLKGVTLELVSNSPPAELFEGDNFQAFLKVTNEGAHDVYGGIVKFVVEEDYATINDYESKDYDLEGKSPGLITGEFNMFTFGGKIKRIDPLISEKQTLIMFHSCYAYKTQFYDSICIDTDPFKDITKGCTPTPIKTYAEGQGAPVAVTKVETDILNIGYEMVAPRFTITIENKGKGQVIHPSNYLKACSSESFSSDEIGVYNISAFLTREGQPLELDCTPSLFRIRDGKDTIRCTTPEGYYKDGNAFTSPLIIEITYGYTETITAPIKIKRLV